MDGLARFAVDIVQFAHQALVALQVLRVGGGRASGDFAVRFDEQPGWQASGEVTGVDLAEVARLLPALGGRVAGRLTGSGSFSGVLGSDVARQLGGLRGSGRARVREELEEAWQRKPPHRRGWSASG